MSSPIAFPELYKAGFDDFIIPSHEIAPFTTIQNRAKVTRSLKAVAGVERVMCKSINQLQNEFGPNGERVFESSDKDARIRFVGNWVSTSNSAGTFITSNSINDFVEITFYGTGINLVIYESSTVRDYRLSVDGGAEGSNIKISNYSSVLTARNYTPNIVFPLASGLTLGWHTIKMRNNDASNGPSVAGFEILNQRTDLAVYQGSGIAQSALNGLSSLATSSFTDGVTGTRGARVVKYIDNGTLKSAVQAVDASAAYLTSANHTNEEVVRRINFREFGANRADDFSTLAGANSDRAFTLDDGTTTLVVQTGVVTTHNNREYLLTNASAPNGFVTITFVGTGLDIVVFDDSAPRKITLFVDGVNSGVRDMLGTNTEYVMRICSGLPYGTHTVRLANQGGIGAGVRMADFIIYQPKKPSIPAGALEVADYNVMANYTPNTVAGVDTVATGVLRKLPWRENTYVGTWTNPGVDPANYIGAQSIVTLTNGSYVEHTFFGTGFEFRGQAVVGYSATNAVTLQSLAGGSLIALTTTNFPTIATSNYGGFTFNNATGNLSVATATALASGFRVSGLPLGSYKIRLTCNTSLSFVVHTFDIITPIHINQPSLKTGSLSLKSVTKYSPEKSVSNAGPDLSKAKAWVVFDMSNGRIKASYNVSACLSISAGNCRVYFEKPFKASNYTVSLAAPNAVQSYSSANKFPNSIELINQTSSFVGNNTDDLSAVFFGELIDE
jgi:hypothetical protein